MRNKLRDFGVEVVRARRSTSLLALHLHTLFRALEINVVIDVGARIGDYALWLRRNGFRGSIVSFEPVSANLKTLGNRAHQDQDWRVIPVALGAEDEQRDINVTGETVFSSFLTPSDYANAEWGEAVSVAQVERVDVRRLSSVWDEILAARSRPRVYLKMDTQGWDLEVLRGADGCFSAIPALQSEMSIQPIYEGMPGLSDSISELSRLGYEVSGLFPVTHDRAFRLVEVDCVAVRPKLIEAPAKGETEGQASPPLREPTCAQPSAKSSLRERGE
jgi:FkbM family methyltransferase